MLEGLNQMTGIRNEDTRVPVELPTLHKHRRKVALGLLRKRLHLEHLGLATQVAQLDIAITRLRTRRLHTHRQQHIVLRHIADTHVDAVIEGIEVQHQLVRRGHHDVRLRVAPQDTHRGPRHTGSRITMYRFQQDVLL